MFELNKLIALVVKWLLVSVLFAAPIASAKHQLDHIDTIQTAEQCDLCAHALSIETGDLSKSIKLEFSTISSYQPNSIILQLTQQQERRFLSRAPPLS